MTFNEELMPMDVEDEMAPMEMMPTDTNNEDLNYEF
jgi:hypothetical protein